MRYIVQWRYYSSLCDRYGLGKLDPGTFVDVAPEVAAAINSDSPGVLALPKPEPEERAATGGVNRMAKPARNRAAGG